jgi:hypothetical protein
MAAWRGVSVSESGNEKAEDQQRSAVVTKNIGQIVSARLRDHTDARLRTIERSDVPAAAVCTTLLLRFLSVLIATGDIVFLGMAASRRLA